MNQRPEMAVTEDAADDGVAGGNAALHGGQAPADGGTAASSAGADDAANLICSARRCRATPAWALRWNNPKLHEPGYRKVWLACDAHRDQLSEFIEDRGFTFEVVPVAARDGE